MPRLLRRTATVCLVLFLAGSATPAYQKSSPSPFPFAYMQQGCAPTDALALDFYFTSKKSECGKYSEPFVRISIWKDLPKAAPYSIELVGSNGSASRCLRPGVCEAATSGSLRLDKFIEGKNSAGEYELHFRDGSIEKDEFDATSCQIKFMCG